LIKKTPPKVDVHTQLSDNRLKPTTAIPLVEHSYVSLQNPPSPERLKIYKGIERQIVLPKYYMIDELKNICIKISLL